MFERAGEEHTWIGCLRKQASNCGGSEETILSRLPRLRAVGSLADTTKARLRRVGMNFAWRRSLYYSAFDMPCRIVKRQS